jgi:hypothetical protein
MSYPLPFFTPFVVLVLFGLLVGPLCLAMVCSCSLRGTIFPCALLGHTKKNNEECNVVVLVFFVLNKQQ